MAEQENLNNPENSEETPGQKEFSEVLKKMADDVEKADSSVENEPKKILAKEKSEQEKDAQMLSTPKPDSMPTESEQPREVAPVTEVETI